MHKRLVGDKCTERRGQDGPDLWETASKSEKANSRWKCGGREGAFVELFIQEVL